MSKAKYFVPAAVTGRSEMEVFLCAGYDGTPVVESREHLYFPADWLKREFRECADLIDLIIKNVTEAVRRERGPAQPVSYSPDEEPGG